MQIVNSVSALHAQVKAWRQQKQTIALVPTMGNLHQGHISLVKHAKSVADKVIVSIFVNPLQFDDKDDLSAYPKTLDADSQQLGANNCDLLFTPTVEEMYPHGMTAQTTVTVPGMDDKLCGQNRPGHFDGVATVVTKLFNMVQADIAVFGEKDYQQLLLIKKMVADLNLAIEIAGGPTFREPNGLAMSSRNQYLTEQQREQAAELHRTLLSIQKQIVQGERDYALLQQQALERLQDSGFTPEYVDIRCADNLELAKEGDRELRILAAARLGKARLIDNVACNLA
ncbi:MAG: pantoate--beta-alanine ligase [Gammaproteobacteria bacterium]|nr:pantoate--beta-alanine ligase [Gammaproteobacteria bacterium]